MRIVSDWMARVDALPLPVVLLVLGLFAALLVTGIAVLRIAAQDAADARDRAARQRTARMIDAWRATLDRTPALCTSLELPTWDAEHGALS